MKMLFVSRVVLGLAVAVASGVTTHAPGAFSPGLCEVPTPTGGYLSAVAAVSARDVWAVGTCNGTSNRQTLIERWNGRVWRQVPSPNPGGLTKLNYLTGIAAVSARDAWAVGQTATKGLDSTVHTLVLHWNSRTWRRVPSPDPYGRRGGQNDLNAVAAVSASDAWAVGNVILHWNGTAWRNVPLPVLSPKSSNHMLIGVTATSPSNAWAAGWQWSAKYGWRTLIVHWNGRSWTVVPSPNPNPLPGRIQELDGIAAFSRSDAWAVGSRYDSQNQIHTLSEHWNGRRWRIVPSPDPALSGGDNGLGAVAIASPRLAWASGSYVTGATSSATLILRWTGRLWEQAPTPSPGGSSDFNGIAALAVLSSSDAWAVGSNEGGTSGLFQTLILHWNGTTWKRIASP